MTAHMRPPGADASPGSPAPRRVAALTAASLLAFAANSVLCRLAMARDGTDPASFTLVRIAGGALVLGVLAAASGRGRAADGCWRGSWPAATALFGYAAAFSFAYVALPAGTGAFLLFAAVQATMVGAGVARGERLGAAQWLGLLMALGGLAALLRPGEGAFPVGSAALMVVAGVSWGVYSLLGRAEADALGATAGNFARALPMAAVPAALIALAAAGPGMTGMGFGAALLSGVVASGLGYAAWYAALPGLSPARAASVQLAVPVLAAGLGAAALGEPLTARLLFCAPVILGGIALVVLVRPAAPRPRPAGAPPPGAAR